MKNFIQDGDVLTLAAPYDRLSGEGALIGSIFGVAAVDVLSTKNGQFKTKGVFSLKKTSAQAWTQGAKIYWDNTAKEATNVATGNTPIGVATEAAANPSATGKVRLNGSF